MSGADRPGGGTAGGIGSIVARVRERWLADGATPEPGAGAVEMAAFEARYGVRLTADVRAFFGALNGTGELIDEEFVSWWPLERVRPIAEELATQAAPTPIAREYFCFADYGVWCNAYAFRLTGDPDQPAPVVSVSGMDHLIPAAPSFRDFLATYLVDPFAVLHHGPSA